MAKRLFIVVTYSYDVEVLENMAEALMAMRVPSAHITKTDSWYRWKHKTVNATEYKLDILCTKEMVADVVALVRKKHNYEVPAIVVSEVRAEDDTFAWVMGEQG